MASKLQEQMLKKSPPCVYFRITNQTERQIINKKENSQTLPFVNKYIRYRNRSRKYYEVSQNALDLLITDIV